METPEDGGGAEAARSFTAPCKPKARRRWRRGSCNGRTPGSDHIQPKGQDGSGRAALILLSIRPHVGSVAKSI